MNHFVTIPIYEPSHVGDARRESVHLSKQAGFSDTDAGKISIVVTEAATNMLKHAKGGELLLRHIIMDGVYGIELIALDKGPGMMNIQNCMRDGYSTAGSPGTGMGAMVRQSAFFDIYSQADKGTALLAQFWAKPLRAPISTRHIEIGGISTPKQGEEVCGDGWAVKQFVDTITLLISDGLGHGSLAFEATQKATRLFEERHSHNPADMIRMLHDGMKSTRGAAAAIIEANAVTGAIRYAGIGNTTGATVGPDGIKHMISHNGTLGHRVQKIQEFGYDWPEDALLVFMTDGLQTQWGIDAYPGLSQRHPTLIAAVLYRDFTRGRDDATVVVAKRKAA